MLINTVGGIGTEQNHNQNKVHSKVKKSVIGIEVDKLYRAVVVLKIDYFRKDNGIKKSFAVDGEHDFSIDDGTTITETKRFDAISNAANKALDEVLSKIAVSSFK